jgi:GH24 family phage-related lysozyme (muramidase)
MPIQYSPFPEFQVPNVNLLGAYAQGQALRQQELQEERLRQQMDLAERAAGYTANKETREASKAQMEERVKLQELKAKVLEHAKAQLQNIPEGDDAAYQAIIGQYKEMLPDEYAIAQKMKWNADTRKRFLLTPEQQYAQAKPEYMEAGGEVYKKTPQGLVPAPIVQQEAIPGARQDMATNLIKEREGFIAKPEYDVNAYRAGYGSDTVTRPDGSVEKIKPGMSVSREDAERDLQRRIQTEFVPKAAAKVGEENWSRLPENTRAALTSIAYNYGNIPNRIVPAVQSGNPEAIAKAIESLAGDNKGVNAGRRMQEANIARGTGLPGSQAVPAFAAGGLPTFMGGPQIQPPINMMGAAPVNAMAAPQQPLPPVAQAAPIPAPQPVTVGTRKQIKGQSNIDKTLDKMLGTYDQLVTSGDMISSQTAAADPLGTVGRYLKGTSFGQETEKALGSKAQDKRNRISALRGQLLQDIKEATGQTSKELDSNFELKSALERLGDPTMSIESIRAIVSDLSSRYGSGKIKLPEEAAAPAAAPPANRPPLSSFFKR